MKSMFITFEGIEGSGKSTQINLLAEKLRVLGHYVITTREPGGTEVGTAIRKILLDPDTGTLDSMTELLLFSAARRELVDKVIAPALEAGGIVICDRFADSTLAYQGYGRGMEHMTINKITETVCGEIWPNRTIILDLPVDEGLSRANHRMMDEGRGEARFEDETIEFHTRVREGFLKISESDSERVKVIDATASQEIVHNKIFEALKDALPRRKA